MATPTGTIKTVTDINGITYNIHGVLYGECSTSAGTAMKVVSISGVTTLTSGLSIRVKFVNAQTYNGAPTLNLNGLGAKNIKRYGNTNASQYEWIAGEVLDFVYDGEAWQIANGGVAKSPASATVDGNGLISYKNIDNTTLFTLQLPLYAGGVS